MAADPSGRAAWAIEMLFCAWICVCCKGLAGVGEHARGAMMAASVSRGVALEEAGLDS